jgi:acyl carrier protein
MLRGSMPDIAEVRTACRELFPELALDALSDTELREKRLDSLDLDSLDSLELYEHICEQDGKEPDFSIVSDAITVGELLDLVDQA